MSSLKYLTAIILSSSVDGAAEDLDGAHAMQSIQKTFPIDVPTETVEHILSYLSHADYHEVFMKDPNSTRSWTPFRRLPDFRD
jgi:hypothetical protein